MGNLLTTKDVAVFFGVETREVLYAARRKMIKGRKMGWTWFFDQKDLPDKWPVRTKQKRMVSNG